MVFELDAARRLAKYFAQKLNIKKCLDNYLTQQDLVVVLAQPHT